MEGEWGSGGWGTCLAHYLLSSVPWFLSTYSLNPLNWKMLIPKQVSRLTKLGSFLNRHLVFLRFSLVRSPVCEGLIGYSREA